MIDAQGRNLEAVKAHQNYLFEISKNGRKRAAAMNANKKFADWTTVNGVEVLRIENSQYVAAPCTMRRNSRKFDIIDIEAGEFICQVTRNEAYNWLYRMCND